MSAPEHAVAPSGPRDGASDGADLPSVVIVMGAGGVGASTIAAATVRAAADLGRDALLVPIEDDRALGPLLGGAEIDDRERELSRTAAGGRIRARMISPGQAFADHLDFKGVGGFLRRAATTASVPLITATTPGLEPVLVLGTIEEIESGGSADLVVVDAPPGARGLRFIEAPQTMSDIVRAERVLARAARVRELLSDPARSGVLFVTRPEPRAAEEMVAVASALRDRLGVRLLPPVVNGCLAERPGLETSVPEAATASDCELSDDARLALERSVDVGRARLAGQRAATSLIETALGIPPVLVPRMPTAMLDASGVAAIAGALGGSMS